MNEDWRNSQFDNSLSFSLSLCVTKTFHQLKNYSPEIFSSLLKGEIHNISKIFITDDVDKQIQIFNEHFNKCLDTCAPFVAIRNKEAIYPWITEDLKVLMQKRNEVQQHLKHDRGNPDLPGRCKTLKTQVKQSLHDAKSQYNNSKLTENRGNIAATWSILKELIPDKKILIL